MILPIGSTGSPSRAVRVALVRLASEAAAKGLPHRLLFDRDDRVRALVVELPGRPGPRTP